MAKPDEAADAEATAAVGAVGSLVGAEVAAAVDIVASFVHIVVDMDRWKVMAVAVAVAGVVVDTVAGVIASVASAALPSALGIDGLVLPLAD